MCLCVCVCVVWLSLQCVRREINKFKNILYDGWIIYILYILYRDTRMCVAGGGGEREG